jgi:hypothetical protein
MGIRMVIELSDRGSAQTVVQALEAYKGHLRASIARTKRRLATFEARYGVDTTRFLQRMVAEDLHSGDLNQATQHWDPMLVQRVLLLPPDAGEGGDGGASAGVYGQALHPHPSSLPSQGEGSLCANLIWSYLEYTGWAGEAKLLEGLEAELRELEHASYHIFLNMYSV